MKTAPSNSATASSVSSSSRLELVCFAASPAAVCAAIDAGADWVRIPYRPAPSCSSGLKNDRLGKAIRYVHGRRRKLALDLHSLGPRLSWQDYRDGIALAAAQGFDAIVLSDFSLALYCAARFPAFPLHFVARLGMCSRTATLLKVQMNAARILVPNSLSMAQLVEIAAKADLEVEVLASEGTLVADASMPTHEGLLSEWTAGDASCNDPCYSSKRHLAVSLQQLPLLTALVVRAIQVEPRIDMPAEVANVSRVWRSAIDRCIEEGNRYAVDPSWQRLLGLQHKH